MEYTVEQLAEAAGVAIDTIRFYQARGLLAPPRRQGRRARYGASHLSTLKRIKRYQAEGFSLAVVKRLLAAGGKRSKTAALLAAVSDERGEPSFTRAELAAAAGVPEALLASVEAAGLLTPLSGAGEARYGEADVRMARAALAILGAGLPLPEVMQLAVQHAQNVDALAGEAVALFDRFVHEQSGRDRDPQRVAELFRQLVPAATTLVALHFQRTLLQRALARLRAQTDGGELDRAVADIEARRLEVAWR
ncbi:MAG: MerR family transcriptional regulator [Candidatus Binatia bacterium]